jgi:hypothetical protein
MKRKKKDIIYPYIHHTYTCFIHFLHRKFICFIHYIHYKCSPNLLNPYKSSIILCRNKNKTTYHSMPISAESQVQEILYTFPLQLVWPIRTCKFWSAIIIEKKCIFVAETVGKNKSCKGKLSMKNIANSKVLLILELNWSNLLWDHHWILSFVSCLELITMSLSLSWTKPQSLHVSLQNNHVWSLKSIFYSHKGSLQPATRRSTQSVSPFIA